MRIKSHNRTVEIQLYAFDQSGECVWAGVHWVKAITRQAIVAIQRNWEVWRKWYDTKPENLGHDYPAKHVAPVNHLVAFPVGEPDLGQWFEIAPRPTSSSPPVTPVQPTSSTAPAEPETARRVSHARSIVAQSGVSLAAGDNAY